MSKGVRNIHSNDVSLYSCAIGSYLAGNPIKITVDDEELSWLNDYLEPGLSAIGTLFLCSEMLKFYQRFEPYYQRMWNAYVDGFSVMHQQTLKKLNKVLKDLSILSFWPGDVIDFVVQAPEDAVVISFPPTYKGGYERLYRVMDKVFKFSPPKYQIFDEARFHELIKSMQRKSVWITLRDTYVEALEDYHVATMQTSLRSKPVYVYSNIGRGILSISRQKIDTVPLSRLEGEARNPLRLIHLTASQFNSLRAQYLSSSIVPAGAHTHLAIVCGDDMVGACSFTCTTFFGDWCDVYMMSDFVVRPTVYTRLSKLVLASVLSDEMRIILQISFNRLVRTVGTTAFTKKAVSMKYRGLFDLVGKKENSLNYLATAGRWTLEDGFAWWKEKHAYQLTA